MADRTRAWLEEQVAEYRRRHPRFRRLAGVLEQVLRAMADRLAPLAIVQVRTKTIASFAEKALRKGYPDPVDRFTDLCGARVITRTRSEVEAVARWIEDHFDIDRENSVDASARLQPTEFGYRSTHYIVSFRPGVDVGVEVPRALLGLKAEIQVRTLAEHAWADFGHDVGYKGTFLLPERWQRALAVVAAELEDIDAAFSRIEEGLRSYAASYGSYMSEDQIREEMARLRAVLRHDPENDELAGRIGKLAMTVGDWDAAVQVMARRVRGRDPGTVPPSLLRDVGVALCKRHGDPGSAGFRRGRRYLERAVEQDPEDTDALASLAGTWKGIDDGKAADLYRRAFEVDPGDFYPLTNFLDYEVARAGDTSIMRVLAPVAARAIERCRAQAEVGINLPWVFFGMAKLFLLLGRPHDSLAEYARAIRASTAAFMIEGALDSLERLKAARGALEGYEWARRMLVLGLAVKFPSPAAGRRLRRLASPKAAISPPVVIVAGSTDPAEEERMRGYQPLLREAFADFQGTVVSGGTRQGASGLAGDVGQRSGGRISTLGYLPRRLPSDATRDDRYSEIRRTDGRTFSPLEPIQSWIDLVASGVDPAGVKVLGLGGGPIAALEYRVALALGATVGVVRQTGREGSALLADEGWAGTRGLVPLPEDPQTVRAFIGTGAPVLDPEEREAIGRRAHDAHRAEVTGARAGADPAMQPWEALSENLRESNRQQADDVFAKLRRIGCTVERVTGRAVALMEFTEDEVEVMAEMEHGRWNAERLTDGWAWGERRDPEAKISPYLVPWSQLPEDIREWDRQTVRRIPEFLAAVGLEVRRSGV